MKEGILVSLLIEGHLTGTLFLPSGTGRIESRKRWLAFTGRPAGAVHVDAGAREALLSKGKSLLASGIRKVEGNFKRGDLVSVRDEQGKEFARGLIHYSSAELEKVLGLRSEAISDVLGRKAEEAIHRDFLVIIQD
jgi:glutamate 5-kinase